MAANFNFKYTEVPQDVGGIFMNFPALSYTDAKGNEVELMGTEITALLVRRSIDEMQFKVAESYSKKTYAAKTLVTYNRKLYYNPNAINTAENWTAAHWTETTVADYIKLMTTT